MSINIILNGKKHILDNPVDLASLLEMVKVSPEKVIVELNRELVHKSAYGTTILKNGDVLELIRFVGGG